MAKYQVATIERPAGWNPRFPDDVPPEIQGGYDVVGEADDLFAAVRQAIELNQKAQADAQVRWALVVDAESPGLTWKTVRICTPIRYKIAAIWRSDGWEPTSPYDVPNCPWRAKGRSDDEAMPFVKAADTVVALNRQSMDSTGPRGTWLWRSKTSQFRSRSPSTAKARKRPCRCGVCT